MNLDDKITHATSGGDLAGQLPETVPAKGPKRRKSVGANGGSTRKARKATVEDDSADDAAALTMGAGNGGARQRKKMLFEASDVDAPPSVSLLGANGNQDVDPSVFAAAEAAAQRQTPVMPEISAPAAVGHARSLSNADRPLRAAAAAEPAAPASVEPAAEPEPAAPVADMKGSVFQVATLVLNSSLAPKDSDKAPPAAAVARNSVPAEDSPKPADVPTVPALLADADEPVTVAPARLAEPQAPAPAVTSIVDEPAPMPNLAPVEAVAAPLPQPEAPVLDKAPVEAVAAPLPQPEAPVPDKAPVEAAATPVVQPEAPAQDKAPTVLSRSAAIAARAARLSAQSSARQPVQAQPPVRAPEPPRPAELPVHAGDIYGYWTRVKNGRRFPSRADFDAEQLAEHWPNSMLLTCAKAAGNSPVTFSSVLRLGANRRSRPGDDLNFTSMITEWILSTGGEAARAGKPVQDTEVFPTPDGTHAYKIVALPLSDHQTHVDHVLCHLSRS